MSERLVTTYTMWSLFRNCRKAAQWRYELHLVPIEKDRNLFFGALIHECLEAWHRDRAIAPVLEHIDRSCPNRAQDPEQRRSWHYATAMMKAYAARYAQDGLYRSRIVMARHGFGQGEYKYFAYPLPDIVGALRTALYPHLVPVANRWNAAMGIDTRYPAVHADYLARCHQAGQSRPTPLLLQYGPGDYNCLHQDLYGEHVFPLQVAFLLSQPGRAFTGGEFVLTEQRPRMQSRAEVVPLRQGEGVIFPVHHRPVRGTRGRSSSMARDCSTSARSSASRTSRATSRSGSWRDWRVPPQTAGWPGPTCCR